MPIDMVARLEGVASFTYVSSALSDIKHLAAPDPCSISREPAADMPIVVADLSEQIGVHSLRDIARTLEPDLRCAVH